MSAENKQLRVGVVVFPGSNCDRDCLEAVRLFGMEAAPVWHRESSVQEFDAVILPGGFSYGDYLRCGAIARFSPIMAAIRDFAEEGGLVLGICNGFQVLTEAGVLPGALVRNRGLRFICRPVTVKVEHTLNPISQGYRAHEVLTLPIAHADGCYWAAQQEVAELEAHHQILFRYCDPDGAVNELSNPNGSVGNIAGICNRAGNVIGMMPHPERAIENLLGGSDGRALFESLGPAAGQYRHSGIPASHVPVP